MPRKRLNKDSQVTAAVKYGRDIGDQKSSQHTELQILGNTHIAIVD